MSRDIRSYFTSVSKKPTPSKTDTKFGNNSKKRSISDDDDNDVVPATPENRKQNKSDKNNKSKRQRIVVLSSDSETENDYKKGPIKTNKEHERLSNKFQTKPNKKVIKEVDKQKIHNKKKVNPLDAFGSEPIIQDKVPKKQNSELNIHDDDDFDKTLMELDEDDLLRQVENNTSKNEVEFVKGSISSDDSKSSKDTPVKNVSKNKSEEFNVIQKVTPKKNIVNIQKSVEKTPSQKRKLEEDENESTMDLDQERYEKKRHCAVLYQQFLNRSGPAHRGSKWIPNGKPNCLQGLSFIITGVLDSLDRDEAQNLIIEHGGRCLKSVSGKVNYMVLGNDAGPIKIEKARKLGTKIISEDDLIDLICIKSEIKNNNTINKSSSEDVSSSSLKISNEKETNKTPNKKKVKRLTKDNKETSLSDDDDSTTNKTSISIKGKVKSPVKVRKETISSGDDDNTSDKTSTSIRGKIITPVKAKKETISSDDDDDIKIPLVTIKPQNEVKKKDQKQSQPEFKKPLRESKITVEKKIEKLDSGSLWVDKYKPKDITAIIGQQGENSNMNKLLRWLKNWHKNRGQSHSKPSPWAKDNDGAYFRSALLSGSPGVGKTTTATLVCKHLGWDTVEFNASDTRNKRMIHSEVSQILKTTSLAGYVTEGANPTKKHVLLMDEVDGMSGNEDRGGIQELIGLIKSTNIPIICMCNDRQHPKIRSLAGYCYDLRFSKPRVEQICGSMMSVCCKENISIKSDVVKQIIQSTDQDVRQTLNQLSLLAAGDKVATDKTIQTAQKDIKLGPWEVIRKVFSAEDHKNMTLIDHSKLFFYDYSIGPLFVQENYLKVIPHCSKSEYLDRFAQAADAISMGDVIDSRIRSTQNWSLLDVQAMYASVLPGYYLRGHFGGQIDFPSWLGKNSKANKFLRLTNEIYGHTRINTTCDRTSISLDVACALRDAITGPLLQKETDGIPDAMDAIRSYNLMREDLNSLCELANWFDTKGPFEKINPKVKAAFTRAYNKENITLPYATPAGPVKKRTAAVEDEFGDKEDEETSDTEQDDNVDTDGMIKMKNSTASKNKAAPPKPSSSKGKTSGRGGSRGGKRGK